MRIVFMGTPDFGLHVLDAVMEAGHEVVVAYTQPPRPGGRRGRELTPSPVQQRAQARGIEVRTPRSLRSADEQARFAELGADVGVVAAYGLILPQAVLDAPRLGCLNVHGSLLPRWRGAAPIQRAIMAGDGETGACIMQMDAGLDTGPVRLCERTHIGTDSAEQVTARVALLGADLMCRVLARPDAFPPVPQDGDDATYAPKITKAEAHLDFNASAASLARQVQALTPYPGAFFMLGDERIKVHRAVALDRHDGDHRAPGEIVDLFDARTSWGRPSRARETFVIACADGYVLPTSLQRPGKARTSAAEFLNGFQAAIGRTAA